MPDLSQTDFYEWDEEKQQPVVSPETPPLKNPFHQKRKRLYLIGGSIIVVILLVLTILSLVLRFSTPNTKELEEEIVQNADQLMAADLAACEEANDIAACQQKVRSQMASLLGETVICSGLEGIWYTNCVQKIASTQDDLSLCNLLAEEEISTCTDTLYLKRALNGEDYGLCAEIQEGTKRESCEANLLPVVIEANECIKYEIDAEVCSTGRSVQSAIDEGTSAACEALETQQMRDECFEVYSALDSDGDGISNQNEEKVYFTDPKNADTDGDGYEDGVEVQNGFNPLQ